MSRFKFVLAGVLAVVLLASAIGGTIVLAQGPTPTPPAGGTTPPAGGTTTPSAPRTLSDLYWQILAQKFGMSLDKLQQTLTDARKEAITQGVAQGLLTQAQADRLLQQLQNSRPGTVFDGFGPRGPAGNTLRDVYASIANAGMDAAAKTLGLSTNDLTSSLRGGKTLLDIAREKNVDVTKLRTDIADAEKAAVDQAVKDGKLTQAQGDSLKTNLKPENIDLNRRSLGIQAPVPPGRGLPGNFGRGFDDRFRRR